MKQIIKKIGKKTALVIVSALLAGTGATMAAFAAIPHSSTGLVAGCYTNATGAVRVIDAEANDTCTGNETGLSWSTSTSDSSSAMLRLVPDPNDNLTYVMDTSRSRNVLDVHTLELEGNKYLCVKVAFRPEIKIVNSETDGVGGGSQIDLIIPMQGSDFAAGLETLCGAGFNAISFITSGNPVTPQSIFLTK